jgi:tetratricopeptide (TPR) repeat protein
MGNAESESLDSLVERALALDARGRDQEARDAYIEVIKREPSHLVALGNLATLLYTRGYRRAARLTYAQILKYHPSDLPAHVNLANAFLEEGELEKARQLYEASLAIDSDFAAAHQGLSYVLAREGQKDAAERHRAAGFRPSPVAVVRYRGDGQAVTVLLLVSAERGNVATAHVLDERIFTTVKLFVRYYDGSRALPLHDVIFNAIGDADCCMESLTAAQELLARHKPDAPVINPPALVQRTGRVEVARLLRGINGLVVPHIAEVERSGLDTLGRPFPLLLRAVGYHMGEHFELVRSREELAAAAARLPGDRLIAIEFLDARGRDGAFRKYRVLFIGGKLYPIHLARSSRWKVHYFSADSVADDDAIEEEAAFLEGMPDAIGPSAIAALECARDRLGLQYAGIDFGLDATGRVLLFEANATMKIVPPAKGETNDRTGARTRAADAALAAVRTMLLEAASRRMQPERGLRR